MHVRTLNINQHLSSKLNLKSFTMTGMSNIVVLTGANGCGKTRLLSSVDWLLHQFLLSGYQKHVDRLKVLNSPEGILNKKTADFDGDPRSYYGLHQQASLEHALRQTLAGLDLVFRKDEPEEAVLTDYVELSEFLRRPLETFQDNTARLSIGVPRNTSVFSRTSLLSSPLSYIMDICQQLSEERDFESLHGEMTACTIHPDIEEKFSRLQRLTSDLTSMHLTLSHAGALLNDIPLDAISLSEGQARLMRWVVLFHSNVLEKLSVPILLDEPEIHLHPHALNKLFNLLLTHAPECQVWVATHSLSLIAHLATHSPRSIWFGTGGEFSNAGKQLSHVVESLMGGEGSAEQLIDYCANAERFAFNSFATDCLIPPTSVDYKEGDPQIKQIVDLLKQPQGTPITLLDFGAGRGRLLDGLVAAARARNQAHADLFSYYAFEPDDTTRVECLHTVAAHYTDIQDRVFGAQPNTKKINYDLIVMANLLHEILPAQWTKEVFLTPLIAEQLNEGGHILILEDTLLPTGELAHKFGFLILEHDALEKLFSITPLDYESGLFVKHSARDGRLQATLIEKSLISRISDASVTSALQCQLEATLAAIRTLRKVPVVTYMQGRKHAYLAQLATNLHLALEELKNTASVP